MRALALALAVAAVSSAGPLTAARRGPARQERLRRRGGNAATEKAVAAALDWLARHQGDDGSWDADGFCDTCDGRGGGWHGEQVPCPFDREVTALAALAFLGAGHAPGAGAHGPAVERALAWLADHGRSGTLFGAAYTTQALAEAWDLTGDARWKGAAQAGVDALLAARRPDGGWRYYAGARMASGVPTTTAVVSALGVAAAANLRVDAGYREPVLRWLDPLVDRKTGRVAYTVNGHRLGYTPTTTNAASALLIRARLGVARTDPGVRRGVAVILKRKPRWSIRFKRMRVKGVERMVQIGYLQHYYWWHGTESLGLLDDPGFKSWYAALKKALLPKQRRSGHEAGSWDPAGTYGRVGGRVYSTALCALALECPYRT